MNIDASMQQAADPPLGWHPRPPARSPAGARIFDQSVRMLRCERVHRSTAYDDPSTPDNH